MSLTNPHVDKKSASTVAASVDTDGSGDVVVTVSELREIESVADVTASTPDGYVAQVQSVSGNDVTVRIFQSAGSAAALAAATGTADVTDVHITAQGK